MSKWTLLFVLLGMLNTNGAVYSQNGQQITLLMRDVYLKDVLWEIERQTSFVFMYNQEDLDKAGKVTVDVRDSNISEILKSCLKGTGLTYVIQDEVIVLKPSVPDEEKKKEIRIVGKVTDEKKQPLPGVTVLVKGLTLGTATDLNGKYKLTLPEMKDVALLFSFMGMKTREVRYVGKDTINVVLEEDKKTLDDVVVTGYATVKKESFTGNAISVKRDELLKANNQSVIAALQHFDPSFRIKENTIWGSDPNALPEFNIRGEGSIAMKKGLEVEQAKRTQRTNLQDNPNLPVFILDGFEVSVQKIYDMDMNRIESMTILKDAAATAIYGSRAANGVVVVTTVSPKPGEMRINYNVTGGAEFPDLSDYNLCNAEQKLEVEKLSGKYTASEPSLQVHADQKYMDALNQILRGVKTDWLALPLRNVFNHSHSLSLQGGVESIRYSLDVNYDSNNGAMKGSYRQRAGAGLSLDFRNKKWLQILNSITYNSTRTEDSPYGNFQTYAQLQPYYALYDKNNELVESWSSGGSSPLPNPLWRARMLDSYTGKGTLNDLTENLSVNLYILDGVSFKGQFSITKTDSETKTFMDPKDPSFANVPNKEKGSLFVSNSNGYTWNVNAMFYLNRSIDKHFVNATLGVNMQESHSKSSSMNFVGFQLGNLDKPAYAASQKEKTSISTTESRLIGILGSVNYSYNNVYLLDASFRLDGSSQFGSDKRFAPFWSLGLGLNIHNYSWLKDNWLINTLRVRGSYGSTGKVSFPAYSAVTTYKTDLDSWYYTGPANSLIALGNTKLTWEKTNTLDVGFSVGILNDLISLEGSYYHKKTTDLIDEVAIQTSSGFSKYNVNAGSILNEGFEFKLNATVYRDKDWMVVVNANLGANKNTITSLSKDVEEYNKTLKENYESTKGGDYEGLKYIPLTQYYVGASTTAIYAVPSYGIDPSNGKEKFRKQDGSSTYTWCADDLAVMGDSSPDAQGAFGINVSWKGFFLNTSFLYQWGAQSYNETLLNKVENADIDGSNVDLRVLTERWKKPGDVAPYYDIKSHQKTQPTSRFVQDYNYLSFSSLSFGYDFDHLLIRKFRLSSLGVRFNANDICRWSTVKEERGTSYPYAKNYSFTLNIGF